MDEGNGGEGGCCIYVVESPRWVVSGGRIDFYLDYKISLFLVFTSSRLAQSSNSHGAGAIYTDLLPCTQWSLLCRLVRSFLQQGQ